ncbi:MAG TPA: MMPL family transporter [Symbiobacteriaceae bacterium]|nr:MMPL family transporter [Symbiobacteriaceae bacterium]
MKQRSPRRGSWTTWLLAVGWVALIIVAAVNAPRLHSVVTKGSPMIPGSESDQVLTLKQAEFPTGSARTLALVFTSESLNVADPAYQQAAEAIFTRASAVEGVTEVKNTWNGGGKALIGRDGRSTMAILTIEARDADVQGKIVPALQAVVAGAPDTLHVYVTGEAAVNYDLMDSIMTDVAKAERFVVPIILVVLALIFGSVVAALLPLGLGLVSVGVTMGLFYLYAVRYPVHDASTSLISMLGMGVGVDYALFMVTRFREELAAGVTSAEAARRTVRTSGKAIIFSGATVVVSVASLYLVNVQIIRSLSLAMSLVVVVSVLAAVTLLPAMLAVLGHRVNSLRIPLLHAVKGDSEKVWYRWAQAMMRRPWLFTTLSLIPLLLVAYPTLLMKTGSPGASLLPEQAGARKGYAVLESQFSAGTLSPVEVLVQVPQGTVADEANLTKLYDLVQKIKQDPQVESVVSHVSLQADWGLDRYRELYMAEPAKLSDFPAQLETGATGLQKAAAGLTEAGSGLTKAEAGLRAMAAGQVQGAQGVASIRAGLSQARAAIAQVADGLGSNTESFKQVGTALATVENSLAQAMLQLEAMQPASKADPQYPAVYRSVATAQTIIKGQGPMPGLAAGINKAAVSLDQAAAGLKQIAAQLAAAENGLSQAAGGVSDSAEASRQLADGVKAATQGVQLITAEISKAADGLRSAGEQGSAIDLKPIMARGDMGLRLVTAGGGAQLQALMPTLVNLDRGATMARILVIHKGKADAPETMDLVRRLRTELPAVAGDLKPLVGGVPAVLLDLNDQLDWWLPRVILLVLVITFLILMILMQSLLLPLKAVLLNGLSVAATYGALVLVFQEGHLSKFLGFTPIGYLESPIVIMLFAVLFGLSMDYEVFLLSRVKEAYEISGQNEESVAEGLAKSAGIITGAAAIMVLVFSVFASVGVLTIKEMALGLAVAVFLDASLIRMILAPALMRLAGNWNWWLPDWLYRILPKIDMRH